MLDMCNSFIILFFSTVELLQQRQENAAALKLKAERVGGMVEAHVAELRNEIKVRLSGFFLFVF